MEVNNVVNKVVVHTVYLNRIEEHAQRFTHWSMNVKAFNEDGPKKKSFIFVQQGPNTKIQVSVTFQLQFNTNFRMQIASLLNGQTSILII